MKLETIEFFNKLRLPPDGIIRTATKRGITQAQIEAAMEQYAATHKIDSINPLMVVAGICSLARQMPTGKFQSDAKKIKILEVKNALLVKQIKKVKNDSDSRVMRWLFCILFSIIAAECLFWGMA